MFPNPQDALPLPPHPSLEQYKKIAKDLSKACKTGDRESVRAWAKDWIAGLSLSSSTAIDDVAAFAQRTLFADSHRCALTRAQFVIARSHGFESWPKFARHVEAVRRGISPESRFEAAADAIVNGDIDTLEQLIRESPVLIRARSEREHGATLLHYVSANGVENYRQKTPRNIVQIARVLLDAGADVDATADLYGSKCTTLGLAATSVHPERAGVQEALLQVLLDHGAGMDHPSAAGAGQSIVAACLGNGRPRAAEFLAKRGARLDLTGAAGLGRLDLVRAFFDDGRLQLGTTSDQMKYGFLWACEYGHDSVVEFLLKNGVDLAAQSADGQTGLHWAVIGGQLETVKLLLRHKAPLEVQNTYGGTVLGQALWSAAYGGDPNRYVAILDALAAAGADIPERHSPINPLVDEWLERHGSRGNSV